MLYTQDEPVQQTTTGYLKQALDHSKLNTVADGWKPSGRRCRRAGPDASPCCL